MLYILSILFGLLLIALIVILSQNWKSAFVIVITGAEIIILFFIIYFKPQMTYVINHNNQTYQYYKGNTKIAEGEFTDIYIRLRKDSLKTNDSKYYIVLDGIGIDSVRLTKKDNDIPCLREIGQEIAETNNLNYFDKENLSPHHKVIHKKEKKNEPIEWSVLLI